MTSVIHTLPGYKAAPRRARQWNFAATSLKATTTPLIPVGTIPAVEPVPTVYYTTKAWHSIQYLVSRCPQEVGWLGLVDMLEDGDYLITDIYVPLQTVHGAETDIDEDAMEALFDQIIDEGNDPSKLRYWGHSHVNMGVGPSGQDENQLEEYLDACDWFIRGIYNKQGAAKVDVFDRTKQKVFQCVDGIPVHDLIDPDLRKHLDDEIKGNVIERRWPPAGTSWQGTGYGSTGYGAPKYPGTAAENAAQQKPATPGAGGASSFMTAEELEEFQFYGDELGGYLNNFGG